MMNTTATHFKYIEWRDTPGLHEDTLQVVSELKFLKDELHFLIDLVAAHTLELIYGKPFEEASKIGTELQTLKSRSEHLLKDLEKHGNNLQVLLDDIDVPNELRRYKDAHYELMMESIDVHSAVKKTKRHIFTMLAEIMKKKKQKKLR